MHLQALILDACITLIDVKAANKETLILPCAGQSIIVPAATCPGIAFHAEKGLKPQAAGNLSCCDLGHFCNLLKEGFTGGDLVRAAGCSLHKLFEFFTVYESQRNVVTYTCVHKQLGSFHLRAVTAGIISGSLCIGTDLQ